MMIHGNLEKKMVFHTKKRVIYETSIVYLFQRKLCALLVNE